MVKSKAASHSISLLQLIVNRGAHPVGQGTSALGWRCLGMPMVNTRVYENPVPTRIPLLGKIQLHFLHS